MRKTDLDDLLEDYSSSNVNTTEDIDSKINLNLNLQEISDRIQDRTERKKYAYRTFIFLCAFTVIVLLIVVAAGLSSTLSFVLSDSVLIALITSSLASIVGIFILVMRYLFK